MSVGGLCGDKAEERVTTRCLDGIADVKLGPFTSFASSTVGKTKGQK